jgi:YVTN family beta-propeller protein
MTGMAQTATQTVPVGLNPAAVAVNPVTNKVYVANQGSDNVTVVDGATGNPIFVPAGVEPDAIAVDASTNQIYVADLASDEVTVIDGATNNTTSLAAGALPRAIAVNPVTNTAWVANAGSNSVTLINGSTLSTSTIAVGNIPIAIAVNSVTGNTYVANWSDNTVTVINGSTLATSTVAVGAGPYALAVNQVTNQVYVANYNSNNVTVINGATNSTTSLPAGYGPYAIAINAVTNQIYVANYLSDNVAIIDGASNNVSFAPVGVNPGSIAVDTTTNKIYVADQSSGQVTVIDGATAISSQLAPVQSPTALAVNPVTDTIYVANLSANTFGTNNLAEIDGSTNGLSVIYGGGPINPSSNPVLNPVTNTLYYANLGPIAYNGPYQYYFGGVTALNLTTGSSSTVADSSILYDTIFAVDQVANKTYLKETGTVNEIVVLDGATNSTSTIPLAAEPYQAVVNPATNQLYVVTTQPNVVAVIDGVTYNATYVPVGDSASSSQTSLGINPATNKIYVANSDGTITVIDGATNATTTFYVDANLNHDLSVDSINNRVYITSEPGLYTVPGHLDVIDGATNTVSAYPVGLTPTIQAIDPLFKDILVINWFSGNVFDVNGNTGIAAILPSQAFTSPAIVNPISNKVYFGISTIWNKATEEWTQPACLSLSINLCGNGQLLVNPLTNQVITFTDVSPDPGFPEVEPVVLSEQNVQPSPLVTNVWPLAGNVANSSPLFNFTVARYYSPIAPPPLNVYYQLDTWQGQWLQATPSGGGFSGQLSGVPLGNHVLYFWADDGSASTGTAVGATAIGGINAYAFTVVSQ